MVFVGRIFYFSEEMITMVINSLKKIKSPLDFIIEDKNLKDRNLENK